MPAKGPNPNLVITRRRLPHWRLEGRTYFVTFRVGPTVLSAEERLLVLEQIQSGRGRFYELAAAVVLPDHVHLLLRPNEGVELARIMKGIKGVSARRLNARRGTRGRVWQDESWDHLIRDPAGFAEKLEYMRTNPVRAGLAAEPGQYPAWLFDEGFREK